MEKEIWLPIKGYEGKYKISNFGKVYSIKLGIYMKPNISKFGYMKIGLFKDKNRKTYFVHRLVALAFIKNISNKKTVNHKDGNKLNNYYKNLERMTQRENVVHSFKVLGNRGSSYHIYGKDNIRSKRVIQTTLTGEFIKEWYSMADIQRELGISKQIISMCCRGISITGKGYKRKFAGKKKQLI